MMPKAKESSNNISILFRDKELKNKINKRIGSERGGKQPLFFIISHIEQFASLHAHIILVKIKIQLFLFLTWIS